MVCENAFPSSVTLTLYRASGKIDEYAWDTTIPSKTDDLSYGRAMRKYSKLFIKLMTKVRSRRSFKLQLSY